jgi:hypothetical protein
VVRTVVRRLVIGGALLSAALISAGPGSSRELAGVRAIGIVGAGAGLHVIPFPGTPDVTPRSPVIFSSLSPAELAWVRVSGSRSGLHPGHLQSLPDGDGTAFYPTRPFQAGESVSVTARLRSAQDGTASGAPGARQLHFSFEVGDAPAVPSPRAALDVKRQGRGVHLPTQSFRSQPDLHPPQVRFSNDLDAASGDVFVTAQNIEQPGPMIIDPHGRLVWFYPMSRGQPMNLQVQRYQGKPVLTWWDGLFRHWGEDYIMSSSYHMLAVVHGGDGLVADLHDFRITPQGTALVDSYREARANLKSLGGPSNGHVLDCIIQELDIKTGQVLWEWHSLGHIPLSASHEPVTSGTAFDYFHLNSIQQLSNGNLLISARNTWAVYEIDRQTGRIIWEVGGKHPSFRMGPHTNFEWQHNARLNGSTLSLFDDGAAPQEEFESSAKVLRVNQSAHRVTLLHRYIHRPSLVANSAGSTEILPDGDVFVGWGPQPDFSEYTPGGRQIFNGAFSWGTDSYRAFRFRWKGQPTTPPALVLSPTSDGGVKLYASWNGATQARKWQVLAGLTPATLTGDGLPYARTGFETAITLPDRPPYIAVQAMAHSGQVLGVSKTVADPLLGSAGAADGHRLGRTGAP